MNSSVAYLFAIIVKRLVLSEVGNRRTLSLKYCMYVHGYICLFVILSNVRTSFLTFLQLHTLSFLPLPLPLPFTPTLHFPSPLSSWVNDWSALITGEEPAKDVAGAEALLARHAEHKAEIDEREKTFQTFNEMGKSLNFKGHFAAREVIFHTN